MKTGKFFITHKRLPFRRLHSVAVSLLLGTLAVSAQTWTPTTAPSLNWSSLASSADGNRLLAAGGNLLYSSTNAGANWATNYVPLVQWAAVASSADGSHLAAAIGYPNTGGIYLSTNGGGTWAPSLAPLKQWGRLAMSADGTKIVALPVTGTPFYLSTDSGTTWTTNLPPTSGFGVITISADGSHLAGNYGNGGILVSTNLGISWTSNNVNVSPFDEPSFALSANGNILVAAQGGNGGLICISTNSGVSWNTNTVHEVWACAAASADGQQLVGVGYPFIYASTNSGQTWATNQTPKVSWSVVASSADGHALVAAGRPGTIYTLRTTPSPSLNINLAPASGNLGVSWIVPSTNLVLQQSSDLAGWSNVTNVPSLNLSNLQNQVTVPLSGSFGFYRLTTP